MEKPVVLQGLVKGFGSMGRHPAADAGHFIQLLSSFWLLFLFSHLLQALCMSLGKKNQGVGGHFHGLKLVFPVNGFRVMEIVQPVHGFLNFKFEIQKPFGVDHGTTGGVSRGSLLLEFGEDAGFKGVCPLPVHGGEDPLPDGLALPEGDDILFIDLPGLPGYPVGGLLPGVKDLKIIQGVETDFRIGGNRLGGRTPLTHYKLSLLDDDALIAQDMGKAEGPLHGHGFGHGHGRFVEISDQTGPLMAKALFCIKALSPELFNPGCHEAILLWIR